MIKIVSKGYGMHILDDILNHMIAADKNPKDFYSIGSRCSIKII